MNTEEKYAEVQATIQTLRRQLRERMPLGDILSMLADRYVITEILDEWPRQQEVRDYLND
jgi:hypothetical protein